MSQFQGEFCPGPNPWGHQLGFHSLPSLSLTLAVTGALCKRVGDVGKLVTVIAIFQGTDVHLAPLAQLPEPAGFLFQLAVWV